MHRCVGINKCNLLIYVQWYIHYNLWTLKRHSPICVLDTYIIGYGGYIVNKLINLYIGSDINLLNALM